MAYKNLLKKIGKGLIATSIAYIGFNGIAAAQNNPSTLETQVSTQETQISTQEKKLEQQINPQTNNKPKVSATEYNNALVEAVRDGKFMYDEIKHLYDLGSRVDTSAPLKNTTYDAILSKVEEKVVKYFAALNEGKTPTEKVTNEEIMLYFLQRDGRLVQKPEDGMRIGQEVAVYKSYLEKAQKWLDKDFVKEEKYWFVSAISRIEEVNPEENRLKEILKQRSIFNIEFVDLEDQFPVKYKYNFPSKEVAGDFFGLMGLIFPIIRNLGITSLLRRREADGDSYAGSLGAGLVNGLGGLLILDGLHPLVYPIRMFATPFIFQPIRKALCGDNDFFRL